MKAGEVIGSRFVIERLAGRGAMGAVYRANDLTTGMPVAVKILEALPHAERFLTEASVLRRLSHPAIVAHIDHGADPSGALFLAVAWIDGETLAQRLERGTLTVAETAALGVQIAGALGAAHALGVVHRDVKPANILLPDKDPTRAVLVDFGVARDFTDAHGLTQTGTTIGTPAYMSPEQARGERDIDARADVFALGCVLFECLAGRPPFAGDHAWAVLAKILFEQAPQITAQRPDVPAPLERLISSMLSKERAMRPEGGAAIERDLGELLRPAADATLVALPESRKPEPLSSSPRSAGQRAREQRLVTVLLVGCDAGDDGLRAADRSTVEGHGGRLERIVDGTALGLFSGEAVASDLGARAAMCALSLRARHPDLPMAIATGRGEAGARLPEGEAIDRAVLLLRASIADGDRASVRIDETTAGLLDVRFHIERRNGTIALRGERADDGPRPLLGRPTPCVGREREIEMLTGLYRQCVDEPVARAALVTAEAGTGKTRLRHEVLKKLGEQEPAPTVWIAQMDPIFVGAPFIVLARLLENAAGIRTDATPDERRRLLRARVGRSMSPESADRVTRILADIAGAASATETGTDAPRPEPARLDAATEAFSELVFAEQERGPLVLVIDDLQWGDTPSVDVLERTLRDLPSCPVLYLVLARPEVELALHGRWASRNVQRILLPQLGKKAAERLAREVLGSDIPAKDTALLVERAAGNAFYLEELIRSYSEGLRDAYPETVRAMAQARIERLKPEHIDVLKAASILGETFSEPALKVAMGPASLSSALAASLHELLEAELLARPSRGRAASSEYAFRHAFYREAAEALLGPAGRAERHEQVSDWLHKTYSYDRSKLAEAAEHAGIAGEAWLSANDKPRAFGSFSHAATCWHLARQPEPESKALLRAIESADLDQASPGELRARLVAFADTVSRVRKAPEYEAATARALAHLDQAGSAEDRALARIALARVQGALYKFPAAYSEIDAAIRAAQGRPDLLVKAWSVEAEVAARCGDHPRGVRAVDDIEANGAPDDFRFYLTVCYLRTVTDQIDAARAAIARAEGLCDPASHLSCCELEKIRMWMLLQTLDFEGGTAAALRALSHARAAGVTSEILFALHGQGAALVFDRKLDEARAPLVEALELATRAGFASHVRINRPFVAYLDAVSGAAFAEETLAQEVDGARERFWGEYVEGLFLQAELDAHRGDVPRARERYERAMALAQEHGYALIVRLTEQRLRELTPPGTRAAPS